MPGRCVRPPSPKRIADKASGGKRAQSSLAKARSPAALWLSILALILAHGRMRQFHLDRVGQAALWVVMVTALTSAADYFRRFSVVISPRVTDFNVARDQRSADRKAG